MDVRDHPGNSIEQIEQFISDEYPNDTEYKRGKKFPPGHKIQIQDFVNQVKQSRIRSLNTHMMDEPKSGGKKVKASSKNSFTDPASSVRDIRCQIAKWQRLQSEVRLMKLKDHEHFEIAVSSAGKAYIT